MTLCTCGILLPGPSHRYASADTYVKSLASGGQVTQLSISNKEGFLSINRFQSPDKVSQAGKEAAKAALGKKFVVVPFKLDKGRSIAEAYLEDSGRQQFKPAAINSEAELVFEVPRAFVPAKLSVKSATGAEWVFTDIRKLISN
jgi:hypothetical protein